MNFNKIYVGINNNIMKHKLVFHHNIMADTFWVLVMLLLDRYHLYVLHV